MKQDQIVIYQTEDGQTQIDVRLENETVWLTQTQMVELFQTTKQNVSLHLGNLYKEGELEKEGTVKEYLTVQQEGKRKVTRKMKSIKRININMWRIISLIVILTSYNSVANAQNDWYDKYLSCVNDSDVHTWKALIEQWEQAEPESPDVYAAWYNYYIKLAMTDVVALTTTAPEDNQEALQLMDSTGVVAGYMYGIESYNDSILQIGYQKLDAAIRLFPDRLDLPFGKVAMLFRQKLYSEVMQELQHVLDRSEKNGNKWLWTLNQPLDDGEYILKDSMQDYFAQLFNAGQSDYASQLVEWMLRLYPTDIIFRSDKASLLAIAKRYSEALPIYLSIYEDNPDDIIVASNIAHIYYTLRDKEAALKYYSKLEQCGDSEIERIAKQRIKEIKSSR